MMSDTSNSAKPKIIDFGLARMMSPTEMTNEAYGTLGYIAPEIL